MKSCIRIDRNLLKLWSDKIINKLISDNISNFPIIISNNKEITPVDKGDNTLRMEYLSLPEIFNFNFNSGDNNFKYDKKEMEQKF